MAKKEGVRSQLKTLGANGNISKNELLKISDTSNVSTDRVIKQLDKLNTKYADNKMAPIGLGAAAANSYVRQPRTIGGGAGDGPIGSALRQMMPTYTPMRQGQGGYSTDAKYIPRGQQIFGSYNGAPQLQIKPSLQGIVRPTTKPSTTTKPADPGNQTGNQVDPTDVAPTDVAPTAETPASTDAMTGPEMLNGGGAGIKSATGIYRRKSSWMTQGRSTKGTANLNRNLKVTGYNMN